MPFVVLRFDSGCWIDACIRTTPPAGAPNSARFVSMRPDVQVVCVLIAKSSLQNNVNPVGGAGMPAGAVALAVA